LLKKETIKIHIPIYENNDKNDDD